MKRASFLILITVLLLSLVGCQLADEPSPSTIPTETTQPVQTTQLPVTTAPLETTAPPTEPPQSTEEDRIQEVIQSMMDAYLENIYMYTDHSYEAFTVLALSDEQTSRTVEYAGQDVIISDFFPNIEALHDRESYWKDVRKDILRKDYTTTYFFPEFTADGSFVSLRVNINVGFQYLDSNESSSDGLTFDMELIQIDDQWYVCNITEPF